MLKRFAVLLLSTVVALYAPPAAVVHASGIDDAAAARASHIVSLAIGEAAAQEVSHAGGSAQAVAPTAIDPALPASAVLAPVARTQPVTVRDTARITSLLGTQAMHARNVRHRTLLPHARETLVRLDGLWRAVPQRALAIPYDAIAPPVQR